MKVVLALLLVSVPIMAGQLVGGWSKLDLKDPVVQEYLTKVEKQYNQESNDKYHHRALQAVSAEQQVVSGMNYKIKYEFGKTNCLKGSVCASDAPVTDKHHVEAKIYSQPWTKTEEITLHPQ
ncbi:unnamed protein product [Bursaphelenchus xylophilus]|nr:cystatin CPI-1 [Bursaphelenchus xylophilus]CAD5227503.1 unnamed protein product [Bursaphelenchus xylophilus]CAG9117806.1 unnamed protein product [Bursaphelenchus xylophilus]